MTLDAFRCADAAAARDEPLYGTASFVRRWLLVEQPGSWGPDALLQSGLPERGARELRRRARAAGVRIVLIRRGVRMSSERRQCYFIRTEDCDRYLARLALDSFQDLLDVDLVPLRDGGQIADASESAAPLFLVCTHGRHDACCSIRGNQVSRVACADPKADAWECSHIGGDRFAANLVCFPHGIYYGRVDPDEVERLMADYSRGVISLDHYRGRCCIPFPLQAAEYFVRRKVGSFGANDVTLASERPTRRGVAATFDLAGGRRAAVEVEIGQGGIHQLTCRASDEKPIPRYDLVSCTVTGPEPA